MLCPFARTLLIGVEQQADEVVREMNLPEAAEIMEKYEDRLIYALPVDTEYSTEPVPIGIDLSDTVLVTKYHLYTDTCAVGLSANVPHMDAVLKFLAFATEDAQ